VAMNYYVTASSYWRSYILWIYCRQRNEAVVVKSAGSK